MVKWMRAAWRGRPLQELLWLVPVIGVGAAVKLASYRNFINPEGGFFFDSPDSYDHLRHIMLGVRNFPSISLFDTYAGYPVGTGHIWAPLYDYLFAALAFSLGLDKPAIETLCFFSGPFLFAVSGILLFVVVRRLFGSLPGALAAVTVFTFHPALVSHSLPSNFDHHLLELIICILFLALPLLEQSYRFKPSRLVAASTLVVASLFLWRGSTLYWLMSFCAVVFRAVLERNRPLAASYAKVFLLSSLTLALYCSFDPLGLSRGVSFILISWFQPFLLAGCAAALAAVAFVPGRLILLAIVPAALSGGALLAFTPLVSLFSQFRETVQFMFGFGDPWLSSIDELGGTFTTYGFVDAVTYLTVGYFIAPVAVILAFVTWRRRREGNALLLHFVAWSPLAALAVVYRYAPYSAIVVSLATAFLVSLIWLRAGRRRWVYGALLLTTTLAPSLRISGEAIRNAPIPQIRRGLFGPRGTLTWIKNNTPVTSHYLDPARVPEYGILADWDLGSFISYGAERPAVATPFGWETHGFFEQAAFFAALSQEKALEIAAANRVRYVLVSGMRNPDLYHAIAASGERRRRLPAGTVAQRFSPADSVYYRLFFQDGGSYRFPDGYRRASGAFRLVHESDLTVGTPPAAGMPQSLYKVFEIVSGARITGKTSPSTVVDLSLALASGRGRRFTYRDVVNSDDRGEYSFRVPYATGVRQGAVEAASSYVIRAAGRELCTATVSDEQVKRGATISAD